MYGFRQDPGVVANGVWRLAWQTTSAMARWYRAMSCVSGRSLMTTVAALFFWLQKDRSAARNAEGAGTADAGPV